MSGDGSSVILNAADGFKVGDVYAECHDQTRFISACEGQRLRPGYQTSVRDHRLQDP